MTKTIGVQSQISDTSVASDFELLAETLPQLVWISKPDGEYEYCNKRWYDYFNITQKENTRKHWIESIHEDDREKARQLWNHSVVTGDPYDTELRYLNGRTGEYRWFLSRARAITDKNGVILRWCGTSTNIDEQKKMVEAQTFLSEASKVLSSSLNYHETLNKVSMLAVPHISDWCSIEFIENGATVQVSVAHQDPAKVKWAKELSQKRKVDLNERQGLSQVFKTGKSLFYPIVTDDMLKKAARSDEELNLIRSLGFTSVMMVPITINEKVIGVIQFVSSESKKTFNQFDLYIAEELGHRAALAIQNAQLYESAQREEKQFKALYDSNIIGVIYTNAQGQILNANDAFLQIVGYSREDLENDRIHWDRITPPEYKKDSLRALKDINTAGFVSPWEKEYIKKDGSQVPVIIGSVLLNKKTTEMLSFILDITERKRLEQRKDEFISIASHELKTPLTSIKGYVQILERIVQQMGDEKLESYIQKTNTYVNRLNSLIIDLLDVSKIQSGKLTLNLSSFKVQELIDEVLEGIQQTNVSYKIIQKAKEDLNISADKHRLEQVFTNLLTNAIKYSPGNKTLLLNVERKRDVIQISVQDFGIGISKKEQSKIFDRFYRSESVSKRFSGLGIGLYISYEIIERHSGKMWVESEVGNGSTFFFTIPIKAKTK